VFSSHRLLVYAHTHGHRSPLTEWRKISKYKLEELLEVLESMHVLYLAKNRKFLNCWRQLQLRRHWYSYLCYICSINYVKRQAKKTVKRVW